MRDVSRLETVSVGSPCPKQWSELVGDERRRFCSECQLHVTNLSAMGRTEAEGFLVKAQGRVCVTYVPRAEGGAACNEDLAAVRRPAGALFFTRLARVAALFLGVLAFLPGCRPAAAGPEGDPGGPDRTVDPKGGEPERLLGKVRVDPQCVIDDEKMLMGEMVMGDMAMPEDEPGAEPPIELTPQDSGDE